MNLRSRALASLALVACILIAKAYAQDIQTWTGVSYKTERFNEVTAQSSTSTFTKTIDLRARSSTRQNVALSARFSASAATVSIIVFYWNADGSYETQSEITTIAAGTIANPDGTYGAPVQVLDSIGAAYATVFISTAVSSGTVRFYAKPY